LTCASLAFGLRAKVDALLFLFLLVHLMQSKCSNQIRIKTRSAKSKGTFARRRIGKRQMFESNKNKNPNFVFLSTTNKNAKSKGTFARRRIGKRQMFHQIRTKGQKGFEHRLAQPLPLAQAKGPMGGYL